MVAPQTFPPIPDEPVLGLYVHVPFCAHKCHYCDFYSITGQSHRRMEQFAELVLRELDSFRAQGLRLKIRTVFFGGGTPTLLPPTTMQRLLRGLRDRLDLGDLEEWTIEANPATVTLEYCAMLRELGVDRLSFGAQSFRREELVTLERHHRAGDVQRSVAIAREAGYRRLNLDLIYAIPGQDLASWRSSLEAALAISTGHLSCYNLTFEPDTPITVQRNQGLIRPAEEALELAMFHECRRVLSDAGLRGYEISNYAAPGQECRHNLLYWHGGNYLGLGPSAASHVGGHRWKNSAHLGHWEESVSQMRSAPRDYEVLSPRQRAGELAMLTLRLEEGLNFAEFAARGWDARIIFADPLERLGKAGLLQINDKGAKLSRRGLELADAVAGEFLQAALAG